VRRAAQEVSEGAVRQIVETFLADAFGEGFADVAVRSIELPGPIRIPLGPYGARVLVSPGTQLVGRTRLQVEFTAGDRPVKTVWVVADVERYGSAVVARRAIARGEPIQAEDLQVDRRELTQMPREIVTRVEDAVGTVARTALVPYVPIRRDQVAVAPLVRRGDAVLLVLEHGLLRLSAPGEVRHDAGPGEQVRVVNRSSRRELVGRVLDARTVAVEF
jgi:flagella basal body P-ring formation protein FlgA